MSVQVGDVVELDRQSGGRYPSGRYVVAQFLGAPNSRSAKLVTKNTNGVYTSFVHAVDGLTPVQIKPFQYGEKVVVHSTANTGTFLRIEEDEAVAHVSIEAWSRPLQGTGRLAMSGSQARVPLWALILENRL